MLMHKANTKKWADLKGCGLKCGVVREFIDEKFGIIYPVTLEVYFVEHSQALY